MIRLKNISRNINPSSILLKLSYEDISGKNYSKEYIVCGKNDQKKDQHEISQDITQALALYSYVHVAKKIIFNSPNSKNDYYESNYNWRNKEKEIDFFEKMNDGMKNIDQVLSDKHYSNILKLLEIQNLPKNVINEDKTEEN